MVAVSAAAPSTVLVMVTLNARSWVEAAPSPPACWAMVARAAAMRPVKRLKAAASSPPRRARSHRPGG
ncbi:MAG: hypothetical protein R2755_09070 [Acidimicrobiales bacterium]